MKAVAQECWHFLSMHGGRFSCMQALETKLLVPRVDAVRVLEWFGGIKRFPHAQQVAHPFSRCTSASKRGRGPEGRPAVFESQLDRSVHRTLCGKGSGGCSARASFYFPSRDGFAYPWVAVSATKVRIIHDLTMEFSNPGVKGDTNFESAPKCKLGHVLRDIVWRIFFLRRTLAPHTHIMLSKMDVKGAFRKVAVEWDGCTKFGYVLGDFVVVDRRLVFGWRNSPGFYCLLAGAIKHAHGSTSSDDAVATPQGLWLPVIIGWIFRPRGRPRCSCPRSAGCLRDRGGGRRARFGPGRMLTTP